MNNWVKHPIAKNLMVYCNSNNNNNNITWTGVASDINIEYRRLYIKFRTLIEINFTDRHKIKKK